MGERFEKYGLIWQYRQHAKEILLGLGYDWGRISKLKKNRIIL